MKNIVRVLEQAEKPLDQYLNEHAAPGDKLGSIICSVKKSVEVIGNMDFHISHFFDTTIDT